MTIEIVTYANKSHGLFEKLIHNKFNAKVTVLGMGTVWNGYQDKTRGMVEYLKTKRDDDIVVFLDGFDSLIVRDPVDVAKIFKSMNCKVLVSKDPGGWIGRTIFGTCGDSEYTANAGMYIGYAKQLLEVLSESERMQCTDDQINLNVICRTRDFIKLDEECVIFRNIAVSEEDPTHNAIFVSYPATINVHRYARAFKEYAQFGRWYVTVFMIAAFAIVPHRYKWMPILASIVSAVAYMLFADRSCEYIT